MEVVLPSATEIFLFGAKTHDSEIRLARFLMKNLQAGDTFCDVGAHFGYFTLLASKLVGTTGKVVSFEASRSTFSILEKNTATAANVTALHKAASDEDKTLVFHEFPALYSEYNSLVLPEKKQAAWMINNPSQPLEVQGQRLDDFFKKENLFPGIPNDDHAKLPPLSRSTGDGAGSRSPGRHRRSGAQRHGSRRSWRRRSGSPGRHLRVPQPLQDRLG
jgi:FkbM family methyltransferase